MQILSNFCNDFAARFGAEAGQLCQKGGVAGKPKGTVQHRDIQSAAKLLLRGDLCNHAVSEGQKAVKKYTESR